MSRVLELAPNHVEAVTNYGAALLRLGRFEEAIARLQQTLQIAPAHAEAHKALGMIWLLQGQWERGWPEYEWRWRCKDGSAPNFPQPQWDGTPLAGRTILLHSEQGLGDTIQFVRFAPLVRQSGGRVIVRCQNGFVRALGHLPRD